MFISYRREDSAAYAGRICDHLTEALGKGRVFMDVEAITPGQNFAEAIDQTVNQCATMLVVIGPRWFPILQERAAINHEDYVRHEVESALTRKIKVIPVLVGGASSSQISELPGGLADLHFHQAVQLRDSSFKDDCDRMAKSLGGGSGRNYRVLLLGLVAASLVALALLFHNHQMKLDQQLNTAFARLETYNVVVGEGQNATDIAGPELAQLIATLDAALARTRETEPRAADILAHIGWAHWLNRHIAEKEFGPLAEQSFKKALDIDSRNVYANAMYGNWLLQTGDNAKEAFQHFATALATGRERPLVRTMQLGAMLYNDDSSVPPEIMRTLNQMRKNNEPLDQGYRRRFLSSNFDPNYTRDFLSAVLSAVPAEEAWQTYVWLDDPPDMRKREMIHARILAGPQSK